jgi:hypothetical protein
MSVNIFVACSSVWQRKLLLIPATSAPCPLFATDKHSVPLAVNAVSVEKQQLFLKKNTYRIVSKFGISTLHDYPFKTIVSAFRDCFRETRMRSNVWQDSFPTPPPVLRRSLSAQSSAVLH